MHFVYIIYSEIHDLYYKGESAEVVERLYAHNSGLSEYTKGKGPWVLVYVEELDDRSAALKREKQIKKLNRRSIVKLIQNETNIVGRYYYEGRPVTSRHK